LVYRWIDRNFYRKSTDVESLLAPTGAQSMEGEKQRAERTYGKLGRLRGR
jgi:hypothetical protein